jgi:hypothetical protein
MKASVDQVPHCLTLQGQNWSTGNHQEVEGSEAMQMAQTCHQLRMDSKDPRCHLVIAFDPLKKSQGPRWCRMEAEWLLQQAVPRWVESLTL